MTQIVKVVIAGLWWLLCTQRGLGLASWQAGIEEFADRGCGLVPAKASSQAQAMYRALAAPGVYRELVEESSWPPEDFERWVGDTLQRNLMPPGHPAPH